MFFGLGFLASSLLGLIIVPFVHGRAVRLTVRRLEAATPLSMAEIQADKDQLRAEFAMSTRRLEMSVDQLKNKSTGQLAELGKKNDVINRLKIELGEKAATIFALEARDRGIKDQLRATEDDLEVKTNTLRETERKLADKEAEYAKAAAELSEQSATSDRRRVEIVARKRRCNQGSGFGPDAGQGSEDRYARGDGSRREIHKELTEEVAMAEPRQRIASLSASGDANQRSRNWAGVSPTGDAHDRQSRVLPTARASATSCARIVDPSSGAPKPI